MDNRQALQNVIDKAAWDLVAAAKNSAMLNLTTAVKGKQLKLDEATLKSVIDVLAASIDAGYAQGARVFSATVKEALSQPPAKKTR